MPPHNDYFGEGTRKSPIYISQKKDIYSRIQAGETIASISKKLNIPLDRFTTKLINEGRKAVEEEKRDTERILKERKEREEAAKQNLLQEAIDEANLFYPLSELLDIAFQVDGVDMSQNIPYINLATKIYRTWRDSYDYGRNNGRDPPRPEKVHELTMYSLYGAKDQEEGIRNRKYNQVDYVYSPETLPSILNKYAINDGNIRDSDFPGMITLKYNPPTPPTKMVGTTNLFYFMKYYIIPLLTLKTGDHSQKLILKEHDSPFHGGIYDLPSNYDHEFYIIQPDVQVIKENNSKYATKLIEEGIDQNKIFHKLEMLAGRPSNYSVNISFIYSKIEKVDGEDENGNVTHGTFKAASTHTISSGYKSKMALAIQEVVPGMIDTLIRYKKLPITSVEISILKDTSDYIFGAMNSLKAASTKWRTFDLATDVNCTNLSIAAAIYFKNHDMPNGPQPDDIKRIRDHASKIKARSKTIAEGRERIKDMAAYMKYNVNLYDAIFTHYDTIVNNPNYPYLDILITTNHAIALIPQTNLENDDTKELKPILPKYDPVDEEKKYRNTLIKERKIKLYNKDYVYWEPTIIEDEVSTPAYSDYIISERKHRIGSVKLYYSLNNETQEIEFPSLDVFMDEIEKNIHFFGQHVFYSFSEKSYYIDLLVAQGAVQSRHPSFSIGKSIITESKFLSLSFNIKGTKITFRDINAIFEMDRKTFTGTEKNVYDAFCKLSRHVYDTDRVNLTDCVSMSAYAKRDLFINGLDHEKYPLYKVYPDRDRELRKNAQLWGRIENRYNGHYKGKVYSNDYNSFYLYQLTRYLPYEKPIFRSFRSMETLLHDISPDRGFIGFVTCRIRLTIDDAKKSQFFKDHGMYPSEPYYGIKKSCIVVYDYINEYIQICIPSFVIAKMIYWGYQFRTVNTIQAEAWGREYASYPTLVFKAATIFKDHAIKQFDRRAELKEKHGKTHPFTICQKTKGNSIWGGLAIDVYDKKSYKLVSNEERSFMPYLIHDQLLYKNELNDDVMLLSVKEDIKGCDTNIQIAMCITEYARMDLYEILVETELNGGRIFNNNTDGFTTDLCLKEIMPEKFGTGLGQLKNVIADDTNGRLQYAENGMFHGINQYALWNGPIDNPTWSDATLSGVEITDKSEKYATVMQLSLGKAITKKISYVHTNRFEQLRGSEEYSTVMRTVQYKPPKYETK